MRHTNTTGNEDLSQGIERLVGEHIAAARRAAQAALERAFGSAAGTGGAAPAVKPSEIQKRRAPAEVAALGERFYRAACAKPGETMQVLSAHAGASARELHRSVTLLRRAGRVRAVGSRGQTRYFPMGNGLAASA